MSTTATFLRFADAWTRAHDRSVSAPLHLSSSADIRESDCTVLILIGVCVCARSACSFLIMESSPCMLTIAEEIPEKTS